MSKGNPPRSVRVVEIKFSPASHQPGLAEFCRQEAMVRFNPPMCSMLGALTAVEGVGCRSLKARDGRAGLTKSPQKMERELFSRAQKDDSAL